MFVTYVPALSLWGPSYFEEALTECPVPATGSRNLAPDLSVTAGEGPVDPDGRGSLRKHLRGALKPPGL